MRIFLGFLLLACLGLVGLVILVLQPGPQLAQQVELDHSRPLPQGGEYVGCYPEPDHLNPITSSDAVARGHILRYTHDSLMRWDQSASLQPALAELISQTEDGKTWLFQLRPGVRFSDGRPLAMEDVLFSFQVAQDSSVPLGSVMDSLGRVQNITVLDAQRFRLHLRQAPVGGIGEITTDYPVVQKHYYMQSVHALARQLNLEPPTGPGSKHFGKLLKMLRLPGPGTGPYQLARDQDGQVWWHQGRELRLQQNPFAWHRLATPNSWNLAGMRYRFINDAAAQFVELRKQQLDWFFTADPKGLLAREPVLDQHYQLYEYDYPKLGHHMLVWNHRHKALADARVRRALTLCMDRASILKHIFEDCGQEAVSWFKPQQPEYPKDLEPWPFDVKAARRLLAEAGYADSLRLSIICVNQQPLHRRILEFIQPAFQTAGIQLQQRNMDKSAMVAARDAGDFDGLLMMWYHGGPFIDPFEFFHSSMSHGQGQNYMGYENQQVDALLEQARQAKDPERLRLYQEFNQLFHQEQPVTLLLHPRNKILLHRRFQDSQPGRMGLVPEFWWVQPKDRRY